MRLAARLEDPASGRVMTVSTTESYLQLYTGSHLNCSTKGKSGAAYARPRRNLPGVRRLSRRRERRSPQRYSSAPRANPTPRHGVRIFGPLRKRGEQKRVRAQRVYKSSGRNESAMSHNAAVLEKPAPLPDYSLTGVNAALAIEKGLAEADWYQCAVPRETMRELLVRRNGPAIRDTILWFALIIGFGLRNVAALGHVVGDSSLHDLCRALRHQFRFTLA